MERSLGGIRVINLSVNVPGPVAGALLRDMGASVTKIEPPGGDPLAPLSPDWYADLVRDVEVLRVDLKDPGQRSALEPRLAEADLLAARGLTGDDGVLGGRLPSYNLYPAREGWVAVAALEPHFAARLEREMGLDPTDRNVLAFAFLQRTAVEWQAWAEACDLPIVAVSRARP